jgi:hypothetical protein
MKILYYHDGKQTVLNSAVLEVLTHYPVIPIYNQIELEEQYIIDDFPILIVLSQPDLPLEAVKTRKWSTIIKYIGVRDPFENITPQYTFECPAEIKTIIKQAIDRQHALKNQSI